MLKYLKEYRLECVFAPLFKMLEALLDLFVPLVVASIIDRGIGLGSETHVYRMSGVLVALAAVGLAAAVTAQFFAAKAATGFAADVRHALFEKLASLSYPDVDRLGVSAMITRMTSDVNQAQTGVNMALRLLLRSPFVVLGAMVMAFTIDVRCALIFALVIAVLGAAVGAIMAACEPVSATQAMATAATAVLPVPTSPSSRRFITSVVAMSSSISPTAPSCSCVSSKGSALRRASWWGPLRTWHVGVTPASSMLLRVRSAS